MPIATNKMESSYWSNYSFLLEMKPHHSASASLFISCPSENEDQKVNVLQNEIQVGSDKAHETFRTHIDSIRLQPGKLSNCSWADETTFTCKIGVDSYDSDIDVDFQSTADIVEWIGRDLSLRKFCENLSSSRRICLDCGFCQCPLLTDNHTIKRAFALPSEDWNEISAEWFCHKQHAHGSGQHEHTSSHMMSGDHHHHDDGIVMDDDGILEEMQAQGLQANAEQCLVGDLYALVHKSAFGDKLDLQASGSLHCARCSGEVGRIKPNKKQVCNRSSSIIGSNGCSTQASYEMYHTCVRLYGKAAGRKLSASASANNIAGIDLQPESLIAAIPKSYVEARFGTLQRSYAWYLLNESEVQSTLKFVVRTLDNQPKLLLWMLDSYSILTIGRLLLQKQNGSSLLKQLATAPGAPEDEEQKENGFSPNSQPALANLIRSFPVVKLLYKVIDETNSDDPRVNGMDFSVGTIVLPEQPCQELKEILLSSSQVLPNACRFIGQFYVGFLKISETL